MTLGDPKIMALQLWILCRPPFPTPVWSTQTKGLDRSRFFPFSICQKSEAMRQKLSMIWIDRIPILIAPKVVLQNCSVDRGSFLDRRRHYIWQYLAVGDRAAVREAKAARYVTKRKYKSLKLLRPGRRQKGPEKKLLVLSMNATRCWLTVIFKHTFKCRIQISFHIEGNSGVYRLQGVSFHHSSNCITRCSALRKQS